MREDVYYLLEQKKTEYYVQVPVPSQIKRGCMDSEFQFLDHKPIDIELETEYGTEFPDFIMAENYVPMISDKLKRLFDQWGIDNLFYKKIMLNMSDFEIRKQYWLALPPRIDCLDPEEAFDKEFNVCVKLVIIANRVGNYHIFKLKDGNDEVIISEALKRKIENEISSQNIQGIVIKNIEGEDYV